MKNMLHARRWIHVALLVAIVVSGSQLRAADDASEKLQQAVAELSNRLHAHQNYPSLQSSIWVGEQFRTIAAVPGGLAVLDQRRQPLAAPNLLLTIGSDMLVAEQLNKPVSDRSAVQDTILGTLIRGQAVTTGRVAMQLVPNNDAAAFELVFRGQTDSRTTGHNGPAIIHSTGHADFAVKTTIRVTAEGQTFDPPQATADLHTTTNDIVAPRQRFPNLGDGRRDFIERVARRRADQLKGEADATAQQHSEKRYEESMSKLVGEAIQKINKPYQEQLVALRKANALFESLRFSTSRNAVFASMVYADGRDMAADTPAPQLGRTHSFAVRLHESLLRNAGHSLLSGRTVSDRELAKIIKIGLGEIPREAREYRLGSHLEPWSATFAADHPILARIDDGKAMLGVRIASITVNGATTPAPLRIEVDYEVNYTPHGPQLLRVGSVRVVPEIDGMPISTDVLKFVDRKANGLFIPEIWFDGLVPPSGGAFERYANLNFAALHVDDGWLALGFDQPTTPTQTETPLAHK